MYEVYSDNPAHSIAWRHSGGFLLDIDVSEPVQEGCVDSQDTFFGIEDLSPGKLFVVTSCGTIERSIGQ